MNIKLVTLTLVSLLYSISTHAQKNKSNTIDMIKNIDSQHEVLFGKGEPNVAYNKYFVGQSYLKPMVAPTKENPMQISNVTFSPACRNHWHTHSVEQILLVTEGKGWYQEEGKEAQSLKVGDIVVIKPKVKHWHGATADSWFTHIAIMTDAIVGTTDWLDPVLDKDYILLKN